jgi:sec-independent protein translocase protein TatC
MAPLDPAYALSLREVQPGMSQPDPDGPPDDKRMTLFEHLEELRTRVLRSVIALGVALLGTMSFQTEIMKVMTWPHTLAAEILPPDKRKLVVFTYPENFFIAFKVSLVAAAILASPVILYQIWRFISAGLYSKERRLVYVYAPVSLGLFLAGASFGFLVLIPFSLRMLLEYGKEISEAMLNLSEYINLVFILTLILGAVFELPLGMHFAHRLGLVTVETFSKKRRLAFVLIVIAAAILTPTGDLITLSLVSVPMYLLFELGILFCRFAPGEIAKEAAPATENKAPTDRPA